MNLFNIFYEKIVTLINTGRENDLTYNEIRYLQFTNLAALVTAFAASNGVFIYIYALIYLPQQEHNPFQFIISLILVLTSLSVIGLNYQRAHERAKDLLLIAPLIVITILAFVSQKETGDYLYFFLAPVGIFFFLGLNRKSYIWVAATFILFLGILYYQANYPPLIPLDTASVQINYNATLLTIFIVLSVLTAYLINTNHNMEQKLTELLEKDHLTGLYNRHKYSIYSKQLYEKALKDQTHLSILIFDLDHFKTYNDSYGHLAGDDVLKQISAILQKHIQRKDDHMFRFGGEEFVAILTNTPLPNAKILAQKIHQDILDAKIEHNSSPTHRYMTCSTGISSAIPNKNTSYLSLFEQADNNLYRAKKEGRNRVVA
jgi:diguanylate cyclase (GGDEF)-like protein